MRTVSKLNRHSRNPALPDRAVVANVVLTDETGKEYRVQLLAGRDTAEWAYDRSDVTRVIKHSRPELASSFAARSAFPIENHRGARLSYTHQFCRDPRADCETAASSRTSTATCCTFSAFRS